MLCLFIVEVWSQLASPLPAAPPDRNRGRPDTWEKIIGFVRAPLISAAPCLMLFHALAAGRRPCVAAALSVGPRSAPPQALLLRGPSSFSFCSHLDRGRGEKDAEVRSQLGSPQFQLHLSLAIP